MNKILLLLSICVTVGMTACKSKKEEKKEEEGKYTVTSPILMDTAFTKDYVAQIQALQDIEIRAKAKGYIESINVDEGQYVKAGQLLFTILPREYEAELLTTKTKVRTAELEMQNVKLLAEKNIVSPTELALSVAKLNEVKAEEALAALMVSYTKIVAPFDGIIDRIKFKKGSLIDEGTLLTTLSNNKEVYAYFNVSETEYLDYKSKPKEEAKTPATLLLANNQPHKYKGFIQTIEGEFDNTTGSVAFRALFPNPDLLLKHGETGRVQLIIDLKKALIIPQKATYEMQDKQYVFVVDKNNVVKARNIVIKQKLSNLYVIESGLSEDEHILLEGVQSVKEDDKIQSEYVAPKQVIDNLQLIK